MKRLLTITPVLVISLLVFHNTYAFVGGVPGGGLGGIGSYHSHSLHSNGNNSDLSLAFLFFVILFILIYGLMWLFGTNANTELGQLNKKKTQEAFIKKCRFPIATGKRTASHHDIDNAIKNLHANAQNKLSNIKCLANYDYEQIVKQTKSLFLQLELAWSNRDFFDLFQVCVDGPYAQELKGQIQEMANVGVYNYIDKTDIHVCSLVKCYQLIFSRRWVLRFVLKGELIDEYLIEKCPTDTSKFKARTFNCLIDITLSGGQLKIYNIIISEHADDYVLREAYKLPGLPRRA